MSAKTNKKDRLTYDKIGVRIWKDIIIGLVVSTALCVALSWLYDIFCEKLAALGHSLPEFSYQDIFFTELSIAFLVISFVTLLANKTETVYWVDVVQYRLVKPNHTSIVDISSYIFANIVISLAAYLIPAINNYLVFSFVQVIFLLGMLSLKLLMAFFGIEDLKKELEKEYKLALDFRKTVVALYYYDHDPDAYNSFKYSAPVYHKMMKAPSKIDKVFGFWGIVEDFFTEYLPHAVKEFFNPSVYDRYEETDPEDFSADTKVDYRDVSVEQIYRNIITGTKKPKVTSLQALKRYRKLKKYSRRFNGNVNICTDMLDTLYTNTINDIEQKQIQKACEQITFLFRHKADERALNCMSHALSHCPVIFMKEFSFLQNAERLSGKSLCVLSEMFVTLQALPEYKIYKDDPLMQKAFRYMSVADLPAESLCRQFTTALEKQDYSCMDSIHRCLIHGQTKHRINMNLLSCATANSELILSGFFSKAVSGSLWTTPLLPQEHAAVNRYLKENADTLFNNTDHQAGYALFDIAFERRDYHAVWRLLKAYKEWLEDWVSGIEKGVLLQHLEPGNKNNLKLCLANSCDTARVYAALEHNCRSEKLSQADIYMIDNCINELADCYGLLLEWLGDCENKQLLQDFDEQIIRPLAKASCDNVLRGSYSGSNYKDWSFSRRLDAYKKQIQKK